MDDVTSRRDWLFYRCNGPSVGVVPLMGANWLFDRLHYGCAVGGEQQLVSA